LDDLGRGSHPEDEHTETNIVQKFSACWETSAS
jgi:hypothetical protein